MKKALIVGITGQDGAYLAHLLLSKGYEVHGIRRRVSMLNSHRIDDIFVDPHTGKSKLFLHYGDLADPISLFSLIKKIEPDEIYNLGAQSHVAVSFLQPDYTADVNALGTLRLLEIIKQLNEKSIKFYQASTSELFGSANSPQNEETKFSPVSPYAISKLFAYEITKMYRDAYDLFACNGILFNHESPLRGETFVTRKITLGLANIEIGKSDCIYLGNLDSKRDWGHARDYVEMQWRMLQAPKPDDFVISTGKQITIRRFIELCCEYMNIEIAWKGEGSDEQGIDLKTGKVIIKIDKDYFRPLEVEDLCGDSSKAKKLLKWEPLTSVEQLISEMVDSDRAVVRGKRPVVKW